MAPTDMVRQREDDWRGFIRRREWQSIGDILADGYTNTDADGNIWTKGDDLANCTSGRYAVVTLSDAQMNHQVYGDNCIVTTGIDTIAAFFNGKDVSGTYRWTDTWVKFGDVWRCVASHSSRIGKA